MKNKKLLSIVTVIGLILTITAFIIRIYADKNIAGVTFGIGFTMFGLSASTLMNLNYSEKHPEQAELKEIEVNDERNVIIKNKAQASSAKIQQWFIIGLAYLLMITDAPLYLIIATVGVYMSFTVLNVFFYNKYQKNM